MSEQQDRQFLLSVFLMEAWDTLATLEEGVATLAGSASDEPLDGLRIVTHRLKGSAALHGFMRVSALAAMMEQIVDRLPGASEPERRGTLDALTDLVACLKKVFDVIGESGHEDGGEIAAAMTRHASLLADPPAEPGPAPLTAPRATSPATAAPAAPAPPTHATSDPRVRELDQFFGENADVLAYFGPEAVEHLETINASLLALEQGGRNDAEVATLFRAVHTLKGAAYTVGCRPIGDLAHKVEDLLGAVRENTVPLTPAVIEAVFAGADALRMMVQSAEGVMPELPAAIDLASARLAAIAIPTEVMPSPPLVQVPLPFTEAEPLRALPTLGAPSMPAPIPSLPPVLSPLSPTPTVAQPARPVMPVRPREEPDYRPQDDASRTVRPSIRVNLDRLDALMNLVGELVIARSRLERRVVGLERAGELLAFTRSRMTQAVRDFESKHQNPQLPVVGGESAAGGNGSPAAPGAALPTSESVAELFEELEFDRYDDFNILARTVAELSADINEIQSQLAEVIGAVRLDTSQIQRLTGDLRGEITRARMVPIGRLFGRFARQVREAARAAGKTVILETSGEDVEMDNTIIEQLAAPLLHLVQNSIAHGIESDEERRAAGKPPQGTVHLNAYHKGGSIYVEVSDDGRGIDTRVVREWAARQGFVRAEAAALLSEREVLDLIFLPGFSTASAVTEAAGRGVGMDVVRTNVTRLNGDIDVDTEVGTGTRFTIKLPLTVAISDAFLVRVAGEVLAIPVTTVRLIIVLQPGQVQSAGGTPAVLVEGELIDLLYMHDALGLPRTPGGEYIPVVVLRVGRRTAAVAVDELLGKEEIVIKSLGEFLEGVGPFSGATISGEGRVILLADPAKLLGTSGGLEARSGLGETEPAEVRVAPAVEASWTGAPRVLLVDDSLSIRKFVGHILERAGFEVLTASDGADALQQLGETSVDVVVTDLEMPRVNGYELIRDLRRRAQTRNVPVVVLTTRAGEKHVSLAHSLGIQHYVTKPVDEQAFAQLVQSVAAGARSASSREAP